MEALRSKNSKTLEKIGRGLTHPNLQKFENSLIGFAEWLKSPSSYNPPDLRQQIISLLIMAQSRVRIEVGFPQDLDTPFDVSTYQTSERPFVAAYMKVLKTTQPFQDLLLSIFDDAPSFAPQNFSSIQPAKDIFLMSMQPLCNPQLEPKVLKPPGISTEPCLEGASQLLDSHAALNTSHRAEKFSTEPSRIIQNHPHSEGSTSVPKPTAMDDHRKILASNRTTQASLSAPVRKTKAKIKKLDELAKMDLDDWKFRKTQQMQTPVKKEPPTGINLPNQQTPVLVRNDMASQAQPDALGDIMGPAIFNIETSDTLRLKRAIGIESPPSGDGSNVVTNESSCTAEAATALTNANTPSPWDLPLENNTDSLFLPCSRILGRQDGGKDSSCNTISIHIPDTDFAAIKLWKERVSANSLKELDGSLCVTLGCYDRECLNIANDPITRQLSSLSPSWPQFPASGKLLIKSSTQENIPLSPPFHLTPDRLIDLSAFMCPGGNTLQIAHQRTEDYVFVIFLHQPTNKQLQQLATRKINDKNWQDYLNGFSTSTDLISLTNATSSKAKFH